MSSMPFIAIDTTVTLFATDEEYQTEKDFLLLFGEQHPLCRDRILRELENSDRIREMYRSDPDRLERIRKELEVRSKTRRAKRLRKELLTMFTLYNVLNDSDEQYEESKEVIISEYFVSDPEEKEMLQRILDGLDELRKAFREDERMKEILAKLKPTEEEEN